MRARPLISGYRQAVMTDHDTAVTQTIKNAVAQLDGHDPWAEAMPDDQELPPDLLSEGHEIPIPRVAAMHGGKRRKAKERDA